MKTIRSLGIAGMDHQIVKRNEALEVCAPTFIGVENKEHSQPVFERRIKYAGATR